MRKRIIRSLTATVLITSIMGMTVLADEVTDIKNQQNSLAQEKQNVEDELAFLLTQMDELELSMAQKNDEIEQANMSISTISHSSFILFSTSGYLFCPISMLSFMENAISL